MDYEAEIIALKARVNALEGLVNGLKNSFNSHKEQEVHDTILDNYNAVNLQVQGKCGEDIWDAWKRAWEKEPPPRE